jgi:hypothetical protein
MNKVERPKIHLMLAGRAVCNSRIRGAGRLGTPSPTRFRKAGDECCERCMVWLDRMRPNPIRETNL